MSSPKSLAVNDLAGRWREMAALMRRHGHEDTARTCELHADELEEALAAADDEELTLAEAAGESGYSKRRLRELLADGSIPNAGRTGAPRVRRADLPRKPGSPSAFDSIEVARRLLTR